MRWKYLQKVGKRENNSSHHRSHHNRLGNRNTNRGLHSVRSVKSNDSPAPPLPFLRFFSFYSRCRRQNGLIRSSLTSCTSGNRLITVNGCDNAYQWYHAFLWLEPVPDWNSNYVVYSNLRNENASFSILWLSFHERFHTNRATEPLYKQLSEIPIAMSAEPTVNGSGGPEEQTDGADDVNSKKTNKYDSGAADLEKVTDYAEEKEVISTDDISGVIFSRCCLHLIFMTNVINLCPLCRPWPSSVIEGWKKRQTKWPKKKNCRKFLLRSLMSSLL